MRLHHILPMLVLGACAARTGALTPVSPTELVPDRPRLPTADRDANQIEEDAGDLVEATVAFCVAPDGHVQSVRIAKPSRSHAYDVDVVHDIADWHFAGGLWTSSTDETCQTARIDYRIL